MFNSTILKQEVLYAIFDPMDHSFWKCLSFCSSLKDSDIPSVPVYCLFPVPLGNVLYMTSSFSPYWALSRAILNYI